MTREDGDGSERFVRLAAVVRHEMDRVRRVAAEAEEALRDMSGTPSRRDLRAVGGILHDFYTGIERIFEKIAPELDGGVPRGSSWHRELLETMTLELPGIRPPVLRRETSLALDEYLRFRHLFRSLYGFELDWSRLRPLLARLPATLSSVEADVGGFLGFLDAAASG